MIPEEIKAIIEKLQESGFEAYAVGGCARDILLGKKPKDWDICTNALPEKIQEIFPESFYENKFGTVSIRSQKSEVRNQKLNAKFKSEKNQELECAEFVEVTTYRVDVKYSDKRHPDEVKFTPSLEEDLARRDFTVNAMALKVNNKNKEFEIVDLFRGQEDLKNKIICAVGEPDKRFGEDALRMMRAVRFAAELDFSIEEKTALAIKKNAGWLQAISKERIRDEFVKIILTARASEGILLLHNLNLLQYVIPEFEKGFGVAQNKHHIYSVFEHGVMSLKFAAEKKFNLAVRLAALLHDVAKPEVKRGEGPDATFYNHDFVGARIATRVLERLKFSREMIERIANLIRNHMFVYDIGVVTEAGVRRLLRRAGTENMEDLLAVRIADRLGSGVPKAQPYRLRHFQYMVEKVQHDAISVKMLKINGNDLMKFLAIEPGPKIGAILDVLLAEVIENQEKNNEEILLVRAKELNEIDLTQLRQMAKEKIDEKKEEEDQEIKGKYWVK